jgi:sigma-B regulation protein RsbU (phosphoserine phosphatase)
MIRLVSFTESLKQEHATTTWHMADTATALVNGDHLDAYLAGEEAEEYLDSREKLDDCCRRMFVSLIYVIQADRSDYGRFVSVFNSVCNEVDDSEYKAWELGHKRDTTNEEYRQKYRAIYEKEAAYETVYRIKTTDGQHPHITTMVPVKNSAGDVTAILCVQRPVRELRDARRPYLWKIALSTFLLAVLSSVSAAIYIRKQFVRPIAQVSAEAARFARENTIGEPLGAISRLEEISNLASSIDTMERDMVESIRNLTAITAEKERIGTELSLAQKIQAAMMPHVFPPYPDRDEFDIYAVMDPAKEVGGDFFDFFLVDEDHLCLITADVSGKGIPAALFMMASKIILQSCAMLGQPPGEILTKTNEAICSNNQEEMFVTVWLGILEISTGKITAANAGHEYPVLKKDGQFRLYKDRHGFVVGGMDGMKYREYEIRMEPGDKLFLYTDGVPEATDAEDAMFGTERMIAALNEEPEASPRTVIRNVRRSVDAFVKDAEQFDDLTMLCLTYKGAGRPAENEDHRKEGTETI